MSKRIILLAALGIALGVCPLRAVAQDADPGAIYLQTRTSLPDAPMEGQALAAVAQNPQAFAGRTIELTGTVSGQVAAGDNRTVLIQVAGQTITAALPSTLREALWIDAGRDIRALFSVSNPGPDAYYLRLITAAPEYSVESAEHRQQQAEAERAAEARLTSRYMAEPRDGDNQTVYQVPAAALTAPVEYGDDDGHPSPALSARARRIFGPYHSAIRGFNPRLSAADVDQITNSILYFSDINEIDPRLIVAMIIAESGFDIHSRSNHGAMGLGQLMPETARGMGVTDPYDPVQNIGAAARILRGHLDKYAGVSYGNGEIPYETIRLIMAAYNAGPGAVSRYHGVPPFHETQAYVEKVASLYREMCGEQ
ncbi:MAG: lytic transglycosylase domain-containing protein [Capsulimonadaceae bacterium]